MKFTMMLLMFCVLALTPTVFAQNTTVNLFDAVNITRSESFFDSQANQTFANARRFPGDGSITTVNLFCSADPTGTVSGPLTDGGLIVDNFLALNSGGTTTNLCGNQNSCFNGTKNDPMSFLGRSAETSYNPVGAIDISDLLSAGFNQYTFSLMDFGYTYASTAINLTTNCTVVEENEEGQIAVCHRNNRNKNKNKDKNKEGEFKTIFVDADDVDDHLNHGDSIGPCSGDSGSRR